MYLGLDVGSQSIKAVLLGKDLKLIASHSVEYSATYPKYKTTDGFHINGTRITSPPAMWVESLDDVIAGLASKTSLADVLGVAVSGQQHGSVYMAQNAETILQNFQPGRGSLLAQAMPAVLLPFSPVWRDHSTQKEVDALRDAFGGDSNAFACTGSRVTLRFTGPQIMKVRNETPNFDKCCSRVCLVSSFITSLLLGRIAPIDVSDGSGMNTLNLTTLTWDPIADSAGVPTAKLGTPVSSTQALGLCSPYWRRYGLRCMVVAGSGDNNNALVGARIQPEDIALSLGTSDTIMQTLPQVLPATFLGHIFAHPLYTGKYMSLLCVTNGALARRAVCEKACNGDWGAFSTALEKTPAGNEGYMGLYYFIPETVPHGTHGIWRGRIDGTTLRPLQTKEFPSPAHEVRAIIESQILSLFLHSQLETAPARIVVTGGSSASRAICQVIADVFGCSVYVGKDAGGNAAAFGAAIRARIGADRIEEGALRKFFQEYPSEDVLVAKPNESHHAHYMTMREHLKSAIAAVRSGQGTKSHL